MPLSPARPSGPTDSGLVTDGLVTTFFPDAVAKHELDPPLKLRMLGGKEKSIRGGGTGLRFSVAALGRNPSRWSA